MGSVGGFGRVIGLVLNGQRLEMIRMIKMRWKKCSTRWDQRRRYCGLRQFPRRCDFCCASNTTIDPAQDRTP
jgi:hypothetical protein